jgi:hypothetical protein
VVLRGDEDDPNSEENGGEILLHVPSGQLFNWAEDHEGKVRFFVQPIIEDGSVDPDLVIPLPIGEKQFFWEQDTPDDDDDDGGDGEGGRPLTEDERLEKEWKEREEERKRRWAEQDAERELAWAEREKELELELELKELDAELEAAVDGAELQVLFNCSFSDICHLFVCIFVLYLCILVFTIMAKCIQLKIEELYGPVEGRKKEDDGEFIEARKEKDSIIEEARSAEGGVQEEDGDEDLEDDEDPKSRSFGKVAIASPQRSVHSSGNYPFPTVFASISLVSQVCQLWLLIIGEIADIC